MELWDAYDAQFNRIPGITLTRGEPIPEGMFHLVSDVIVRHTDGSWLLMQRDHRKAFGGMWEATAGGSALKGETPLDCALRELSEETGIRAEKLTKVGQVRSDNTFFVEFLCVTDCDKDSVTLQAGETVAYKWVSRDELITMRRTELVTERMQSFISELTAEPERVKTLEIIGENYSGHWNLTRTACRGIVIDDGKILLSYEKLTGQWMIPGGGVEDGESERDCCVREVAEETGVIIKPSPCVLSIIEYYEDVRYISRYFFGTVVGKCERKPTERERSVGMEPRLVPVKYAERVFSQHASFAETDEMRRGLYQREFTALRTLVK